MSGRDDRERAERLRTALDRLGLTERLSEVAKDPPGVFEAVTRQMVEDLAARQAETTRLVLAVFGSVIVAGLVALVVGAL